jgi:WD40 repeat protein/class 3 adenylate cyclase
VSELEVRPDERGQTVVDRAFLIADVRGYTRFTRERGDAEAARLAGAFANLARDAVAARGGSVIELRGDEALAVFVSPAQAIRAGVDLVALCAEEAEVDRDLPLLVGIGIDAGQAVPLEGGFRGAAINTAARLCSQAAAGQVLVTAGLAARAGDVRGVEFAPHGAVELKGFEAPVELIQASAAPRAYRPPPAAAEPPPPEPLPADLELDTPMVGRDQELSWLRGSWRQARRGDGRLLFVSGPSGIGRTRLAAELAAEASGQSGAVFYAGSGGTAQALAEAHLRAAAAADRPMLLILDELDVLAEALAPTIESLQSAIETRPALVVCLVQEPDAAPALAALVERADAAGDGHRRLAPLDAAGVRAIAELYAGDGAADVSLESLQRASQGIPGRVHEAMSEWAEREASRRLAAAAEWLSAERLDRQADLDFANNVIGLKLARIYSADRPVAATSLCPYKGLASFEGDDSRFFFGREQLVGELAARTVGVGMLAVIGASGSGKSSAIAAGLVPSLRAGLLPGSDRWRFAAIRPGDRPAQALDAALRERFDDAGRLVLVIDQFEELFAGEVDEAQRSACVAAIVTAAADPERCVIVIGLRADFYGHCASYPELARLLAANQVLVGPMRDRELRRAIELPARRVGVRVDSALVDRLVAEVVDEPGGLPLLSTALVELWGTRSGGWLRLDAYQRAGGVRGAVARLAESSYTELGERQRVATRALFMRLVATGEEGILARRTVHRAELGLEPGTEMAEVVARLTDDRLLTVTDDAVEVAHEALLREWPRLAEWLREDAQGRELREHLIQAARRWEASQRDAGELYRGARLAMTLDWASTRADELNDSERGFLAESRSDADREAERQQRSNRRLRALLAGLSIVLLCAVAAGVIALVQRSSARHEATVALGRQLGAEAVSEPRIDRAMLLARESLSLDRSSQTAGTLLATLLRSPALIGKFTVPITDRPLAVAVAPDGNSIAVGTNTPAIRFYDTRTHRQISTTTKLGGFPLVYMPGTDDIVSSPPGPGPLMIVDAGSGRVLDSYPFGHLWDVTLSSPVEPAMPSPDGRFFFLLWSAVNPDGSLGAAYIQRWSVKAGGAPTVVPMHETGMVAAVVTRDNRLVVATSGAITTWNATTLKRIRSIRGPSFGGLVNGAISPDGRTFGYGLLDGTVHFMDVASGRSISALGAHTAPVQALAFSPDSHTAVSTGDDGVAIVWNPHTGQPLQRLLGHAGRIAGVAFSPDGHTLYTSSLDGTVLQWDMAGGRRFGDSFRVGSDALVGGSADRALPPLPPAALSPDGATLAVRSEPSTVGLFSATTLRRTGSIPTAGGQVIGTEAWAGERLLVGSEQGSITAWTVHGRPRQVATMPGLTHTVRSIATSDGGHLVAAVDGMAYSFTKERGALAIWRDGRLVAGTPVDLGSYGNAVAFSPDGSMLAVAVDNNQIWIMDPRSGRVLRRLHPQTGAISLAFASDDTLASGSWAGIVNLWDPRTGRALEHPILAAAAPIGAIAFDQTGETFATAGGSSGLARLWTTSTLQQLGSDLPGGQGAWGNVAFTPDGRNLLVVFGDGSAYRWPVSVPAWEQHACTVAGRNFTREEWSRYVSGRGYARTCPQFPAGP